MTGRQILKGFQVAAKGEYAAFALFDVGWVLDNGIILSNGRRVPAWIGIDQSALAAADYGRVDPIRRAGTAEFRRIKVAPRKRRREEKDSVTRLAEVARDILAQAGARLRLYRLSLQCHAAASAQS